MQKFYSNERVKITAVLVKLNVAMEKFSSKDHDADASLLQVLVDAIEMYKELGYTEKESQVQMLRTEFVTAQRGVNPITFEKQLTRRHEMVTTICFKVLQAVESILRTDLADKDAKLLEAKELVAQIIVAALQVGLLKDIDINKIRNQHDLETEWAILGKDANISLGQKRVLLIINKYDALILFDELLSSFKT
jgi:hypothetical protein